MSFTRRLTRNYLIYAGLFAMFLAGLTLGERVGVPQSVIGLIFLFGTVGIYAGIGVASRTSDLDEYYVAGRRVPSVFNGMATAADWMSAASFLGLAGALYFAGFEGLAFITGWTGGFVLVALLLAPYLRRFGQYTVPDFLGARYEGNVVRVFGVMATVLASFVYLVAQIYGVGLITSRFVSVEFEIGLFIGLAAILLSSFLGGMRAITWTQVAQYLVIIVAYLVPVTMLAMKTTGVPVPQLTYGAVMEQLAEREGELLWDWREADARELYRLRAEEYRLRLAGLPESLAEERRARRGELKALLAEDAPAREIVQLERALHAIPLTPEEARQRWSEARDDALQRSEVPSRFAQAHPGVTDEEAKVSRNNFIALVLVLMAGTAALPHILTRFYTTSGVAETRTSTFWALFFILLLYLAAPAYAVFAKWEVYSNLVGVPISQLPSWVASWGKVGMMGFEDINSDGILQLAELSLNTDVVVLATPEIAGLPYVVAGLVAAGGLAAALSTADGLLLTIGNALSHDLYYRVYRPSTPRHHRLLISKSALIIVALAAAWVASLRPDNILFMVGLAFSMAAAALFPALVLGIFWTRANRHGAICGMVAGLGLTLYYIAITHPFFGGSMNNAWFGIRTIAAGAFGMPFGFTVIMIVSVLTVPPSQNAQNMIRFVRSPESAGDDAMDTVGRNS